MVVRATKRPPVLIDAALLRRWPLPGLDADGDKEERGRVVVVAGATETPGAAILAGIAALRTGAGKLVVAAPSTVARSIAPHLPEARVVALAASPDGALSGGSGRQLLALAHTADALLWGPGMVESDALSAAVAAIAAKYPRLPLVFDAAALRSVRHFPGNAGRAQPRALVTPHAGEMARLMRVERSSVEADPMTFATRLASARNVVVVLKGGVSAVAHPSGTLWRHAGHTIGLATSGSGDVLAGAIAGLLARRAAPEQAAVWGVALHGLAGESLSRRLGQVGLLAREIAAEIPPIMHRLARAARRSSGGRAR